MIRKKPYESPTSETVVPIAPIVLQSGSYPGNGENYVIDDPGGSWQD